MPLSTYALSTYALSTYAAMNVFCYHPAAFTVPVALATGSPPKQNLTEEL